MARADPARRQTRQQRSTTVRIKRGPDCTSVGPFNLTFGVALSSKRVVCGGRTQSSISPRPTAHSNEDAGRPVHRPPRRPPQPFACNSRWKRWREPSCVCPVLNELSESADRRETFGTCVQWPPVAKRAWKLAVSARNEPTGGHTLPALRQVRGRTPLTIDDAVR